METWRDIEGFEGYQVSSLGRVASLPRKNRKELLIRATPLRSGYPFLFLFKNGERIQIHIHRLVAKAFLAKKLGKNYVNHKNGIRTDNRVENLEWVTHKENRLHACKVLGKGRGSKNGLAKLSEEDIPIIREKLKNKEKHRDIAKQFCVTKSTITSINLKETWAHI